MVACWKTLNPKPLTPSNKRFSIWAIWERERSYLIEVRGLTKLSNLEWKMKGYNILSNVFWKTIQQIQYARSRALSYKTFHITFHIPITPQLNWCGSLWSLQPSWTHFMCWPLMLHETRLWFKEKHNELWKHTC